MATSSSPSSSLPPLPRSTEGGSSAAASPTSATSIRDAMMGPPITTTTTATPSATTATTTAVVGVVLTVMMLRRARAAAASLLSGSTAAVSSSLSSSTTAAASNVSTATTFWISGGESMPTSALIHVLNYLTHDELLNVSAVSKFERSLIFGGRVGDNDDDTNTTVTDGDNNNGRVVMGPGIETQVIPRIEFRPPNLEETVLVNPMIDKMIQRRLRNAIVFQRYRVLKIFDFDQFRHIWDWEEWATTRNKKPFLGIISLDISLSHYVYIVDRDVREALFWIVLFLPKLRSINLSNVGVDSNVLLRILEECPHLESITWNGFNWDDSMNLINGFLMRDFHHLKELYFDDCVFNAYNFVVETSISFDTAENPNNFLFGRCNQSLERLSIKNARYWAGRPPSRTDQDPPCLPQTTLMKFIRRAPPSLQWFRSDLSQENIEVLRLERPGIEFV